MACTSTQQMLEVEEPLIIPYYIRDSSAIMPVFDEISSSDHEFFYKVFSPIDGGSITQNNQAMDTYLDLVIPNGVICHVQHNFFNKGEHVRSNQFGSPLVSGKQYSLTFVMPKKFDRKNLKRGDEIGKLVFYNKIKFQLFIGQGKILISTIII